MDLLLDFLFFLPQALESAFQRYVAEGFPIHTSAILAGVLAMFYYYTKERDD